MRKLKASESRLAAVFAAAVLIALNLLGAKFWLSHRSALSQEASRLSSSIAEGRAAVDAASALASANAWMAAHPAPEERAEQASSTLLATVRAAAESNSLKILEENLLPPPLTTTGQAASLQTKISGSFSKVARFLFALQGPADWRAIPKMTVQSDTEPPNVVVDMEIRQYYRPASPAPAAGP